MELIMSVSHLDSYPPSICVNREEYYAKLVQDYPSYHFFIMEVKL